MAARQQAKQATSGGATVGYESELSQVADASRGSMDGTEYNCVALGLIFLKHIPEVIEEHHRKLEAARASGAHSEDPDDCRAESAVRVPPEARSARLMVHSECSRSSFA